MPSDHKRHLHLESILALITLSILLNGCALFGFEIINKSKAEAQTQIGNISKVIVSNERSNQSAIDNLIQLYASQVEQTQNALWNNAKLTIELKVRAQAKVKKEAIIAQLQENLEHQIDPILQNLQAHIQAEKLKLENNQGGDINNLNKWGAQFSATMAKLLVEKENIADQVESQMDTALEAALQNKLNQLDPPEFTLKTSDLITSWKAQTDAYIAEIEKSFQSIQNFTQKKSPIAYAIDGALGNKSGTDISNLIFSKIKSLATDKLTNIQSAIDHQVIASVADLGNSLEAKYNTLIQSANLQEMTTP